MRKFKKLGVVASAAALVLLGSTAAQAATCHVPSGAYPNIQSAADDPTCNTIKVAAGSYHESVVVNFASTTINGAQAGNRFDSRSPAGETEVSGASLVGNVAVFTINAADVTIDGFTIKNKNTDTSGAAMGVTVNGTGSDA